LRVKFKCISAYSLILYLSWYYPCISYYSCTCWVSTISVLNLAIFLCHSNLLLKRRRWTKILQQRVLGYMLSWLPFLWSYGVFHCSVSLRVIIVFKDIIYVIIILYSWLCEPFWLYVWNNWSWVMYTMSTWFWHKNRVWQGSGFGPSNQVQMEIKLQHVSELEISNSNPSGNDSK
jgi:hypothetical protein